MRRRHVVRNSRNSRELRGIIERLEETTNGQRRYETAKLGTHLPNTEKTDEEIAREAGGQHLGHDEHVGRECRLQHDGHVRGIEELDGVRSTLTTEPVRLDRNLDAETLEIDNNGENDYGGDQVHDVGETVAPEGLTEGTPLVVPGEEEMEEGDDGAFELGTTSGVDGGGGERFPDDGLADVGRDEEGDTGSETVPLLKELVEENDDEGSGDKLDDEEQADTGTEVAGLTIETSEDVDGSLAERNNQCKH